MMTIHDNRATNMNERSLFLVSTSIFNKYKAELRASFAGIEQGYFLYIKGEDNTCDDCKETKVRGVLEYDGYWVVAVDEWDLFGSMTNTYTHRAILTTPQNFAIAGRANQLANQYSGMGMEIIQRLGAPYQGKVYMNAAFEMGTAIVDKTHMVMASEYTQL